MNCFILLLTCHFVQYAVTDMTDHCSPGETMAQIKQLSCESCTGRCGRKDGVCACDIACTVNQDCCGDFDKQCPQLHTVSMKNAAVFAIPGSSCVVIKKTSYSDNAVAYGVLTYSVMVTKCLSTTVDCEYNFRNISTILRLGGPVFHHINNVTYVNGNCARCNGVHVKNLKQLPMELSCNSMPILAMYSDARHQNTSANSFPSIEDLITSGTKCYASFSLSDAIRTCSVSTIMRCPKHCLNTDLTTLCTTSGSNRVADTSMERGPVYKNIYCAMCNGVNMSSTGCVSKKILSAFPPASFSLALHFDLNHNYDIHMQIKTLRCKENELFPGGIDCRTHYEFGSHSSNHSCDEMSNFSLVQSFGDFKDKDDCHRVGTRYITGRLSAAFPIESIGANDHFSNSSCISWSWKCKVSSDNNFGIFVTFGSRNLLKEHKISVLQTKLFTLTGNLSDVMHENDLKVVSYSLMLGMERITVTGNPGKMEDCTGIALPWDDFQQQNNNNFLLQCLSDIYESDFEFEPRTIVCVENMENIVNVRLADDLGYLSITVSIPSLLCLIIRLCLQKCHASFQTKSGKLQFHLALSLAFGSAFLLTSPVAKNVPHLCSVLGGLKYLFFLSSFVWMTCISISLWCTFRPSNLTTVDRNSLTNRQTILTWLFPFITSALIYMLDYLGVEYIISPRFGGSACWFTNWWALLFYFIIPVSVFVGVNTILFILVGMSLRSTFNATNTLNTPTARNNCSVYMKLFLLMGVAWSSLFFALIIDHKWMWYIFVILNSSQGVYLFVAFVPCGKWWKLRSDPLPATGSQNDNRQTIQSPQSHNWNSWAKDQYTLL